MKAYLVAVGFLGLLAMDAGAMVVSLVGDQDGFGGQTAAGVPVDGTDVFLGAQFDNRTSDDPDFTDAWGLEQLDPDFTSPITYTHDYSLVDAAISASLVIQEAGMGDSRDPWEVIFNGNLLGTIGAPGKDGRASFTHTFDVPIGLLTGNDTVTLNYTDTVPEGFAINYSELSVETSLTNPNAVPEPSSVVVWLVMIGAVAFRLRRRQS